MDFQLLFLKGIQILAGANKEAIAVALATGASFIRAEGFVFSTVSDEGIMDADAGYYFIIYKYIILFCSPFFIENYLDIVIILELIIYVYLQMLKRNTAAIPSLRIFLLLILLRELIFIVCFINY